MRSVALSPMTGSSDDLEFAYAAKRDAFAQYVIPKWGWDEHFQRDVVAERLRVKRYFRILVDGVAVGTISVDEQLEHVQVGDSISCDRFRIRVSVVTFWNPYCRAPHSVNCRCGWSA